MNVLMGKIRTLIPSMVALSLTAAVCQSVLAIDADVAPDIEGLLETYCDRCHNDDRMSGNWSLSMIDPADIAKGKDLDAWEKIYRMIDRGEMPPPARPQFSVTEKTALTRWLENSLDSYSAAHINPGRATLRRLNRTEYSNAVRDLLALDVDFENELPADDSGYGFDNIADVLSVSTTLMDRYIAVAGKLSRLAVGQGMASPFTTTYAVPKDGSVLNQGVPSYNTRMSYDLPIDSRGGGVFNYYAPHDGIYYINGYLNANTNNEVDRLEENRVGLNVPLTAGPHTIGMTFRKQLALNESVQILHNTTDIIVLPNEPPSEMTLDFVVDGARVGQTTVPSYHMSPRFAQVNFLRDVLQINVEGPFSASGPGKTPSREKIFICEPKKSFRSERGCAKKILSTLAKQAYRRPVTDDDIEPLLTIYNSVRSETDFTTGVATAIQAILVSPSFLFLYEQVPDNAEPGSVYAISELEFAARLALFIWSSLPDEELVNLAEKKKLRKPTVLKQQIARMLADPRAEALTKNFAGQWLYLRNLEYQRPDVHEFPEFDVPLRQAMLQESELFFSAVVRDNRSILEFINADYSYLNERLAQHYGIDGVSGSAFRKVNFSEQAGRGGLLGQASILTVTSYGNHTSPVKRGKWILDNLLAAPPPPPPPDIPALKAVAGGKKLNAREQMALHREDPACASCHVKMDPLGLALERFNAVGGIRELDAGRPIDVSAEMPDGTAFEGLPGLQQVLMQHKDQFAHAFVERLLTYALARGLEAYDQPQVRAITRYAMAENYRIHSIIYSVVNSQPFNLRKVPEA